MKKQKIQLKFRAYDHRVLDIAVKDIMGAVERTGAIIFGPVPLPVKIEKFTVNRSPHVDKKSREQFERRTHTRLMLINDATSSTIEALRNSDLTSRVDVEIKLVAGGE